MGFRHGIYCVGCCWALMLVMLGVGAMSIPVMAILVGIIALEKIIVKGSVWVNRVVGNSFCRAWTRGSVPAKRFLASMKMLGIVYRKSDLRRALLLSGIVGSWLVSFNQGSAILAGSFGTILYLRILLDYLTPFTVSSVTGMLRNRSDAKKAAAAAASSSPLPGDKNVG